MRTACRLVLSGRQYGVRHHATHHAFTIGLRHAAGGRYQPPHAGFGQGLGRGLVACHQLGDLRIGRIDGKFALQRHRARAGGKRLALHNVLACRAVRYAAGLGIDGELHLGQQGPVQTGAGQQKWFARIHFGVVAEIGAMGVAGDHHIHLAGKLLQDGHDIPGQALAAIVLQA